MGEEAGRKSPLRHAKAIVIFAAILIVNLAPMIALRFFPREASSLMFAPVSSAIESKTSISSESIAAVWIMLSFALTTVIVSALVVVFARVLTRSAGGSS